VSQTPERSDDQQLPRELLSLDETSDTLNICTSYVRRLISQGKIRSVKIGRRSLVSRRALTEYLDAIGA
jgi:excisionase family DNA binding protein